MRAGKPMRIFSALVLAVVALGAMAKEWSSLADTFAIIGPVVVASTRAQSAGRRLAVARHGSG